MEYAAQENDDEIDSFGDDNDVAHEEEEEENEDSIEDADSDAEAESYALNPVGDVAETDHTFIEDEDDDDQGSVISAAEQEEELEHGEEDTQRN